MTTNFLPELLTSIDDALDAGTVEAEETGSLGLDLAFDWSTLSFRLKGGAPVIVSEHEALAQAVMKALLTPRYAYGIYSPDYGADFDDLMGQPYPVVVADIERVVAEAVLADERVADVFDVLVERHPDDTGAVVVTFSVEDRNGDILRVPSLVVMPNGA